MSEIRWAFRTTTWQPSKYEVSKCLSSIDQIEVDRIQKFRFKNDWKLSLIGRLLIRLCIIRFSDIKWNEIILSRDNKGKPILMNKIKKPLFFNVSHHGDFTVLAASKYYNIGVDVMKYTHPNNIDISSYFHLMRKQFTLSEWDFINSFQTEFERLKAFYRLWCSKESYIKAIGTGLGTTSASYMRFNIKSRTILPNSSCSDTELFLRNEKSHWHFQEHLLDNLHIVAVASEQAVKKDFEILNIEEILSSAISVIPEQEHWWTDYLNKTER